MMDAAGIGAEKQGMHSERRIRAVVPDFTTYIDDMYSVRIAVSACKNLWLVAGSARDVLELRTHAN